MVVDEDVIPVRQVDLEGIVTAASAEVLPVRVLNDVPPARDVMVDEVRAAATGKVLPEGGNDAVRCPCVRQFRAARAGSGVAEGEKAVARDLHVRADDAVELEWEGQRDLDLAVVATQAGIGTQRRNVHPLVSRAAIGVAVGPVIAERIAASVGGQDLQSGLQRAGAGAVIDGKGRRVRSAGDHGEGQRAGRGLQAGREVVGGHEGGLHGRRIRVGVAYRDDARHDANLGGAQHDRHKEVGARRQRRGRHQRHVLGQVDGNVADLQVGRAAVDQAYVVGVGLAQQGDAVIDHWGTHDDIGAAVDGQRDRDDQLRCLGIVCFDADLAKVRARIQGACVECHHDRERVAAGHHAIRRGHLHEAARRLDQHRQPILHVGPVGGDLESVTAVEVLATDRRRIHRACHGLVEEVDRAVRVQVRLERVVSAPAGEGPPGVLDDEPAPQLVVVGVDRAVARLQCVPERSHQVEWR